MKKKRFLGLIIFLIVAVNAVTIGIYAKNRDIYTLHVATETGGIRDESVTIDDPDIVSFIGSEQDGDYYVFRFKGLRRGETKVYLRYEREGKPSEKNLDFYVSRSRILVARNIGDFDGWQILGAGFVISILLICVYLNKIFAGKMKSDLYSYKTILTGGLTIFVTGLALAFGVFCLIILPSYALYNPGTLVLYLEVAFFTFTMAATIPVLVFAIALSISNIQLIRKEGFRPANALGIAISFCMVMGVFCCLLLPVLFNINGHWYGRYLEKIQYVLSALFCLFLSFMLSTMICGLVAAKRVPELDQDYIIILGCGIRKDGTLYPLLQGRVDRAIWFWRRQLEETGKKAVFIPSGGQGSDEIISEGEAMRRYLVSQGIPAECIMPETASATTRQNMKFSKAIVDSKTADANVIFSTTNYHVFRSGILAGDAGLKARGIGSKTRWYFWPNAFVREFIGLLVHAWKFELVLFGGAALVFILLRYILG